MRCPKCKSITNHFVTTIDGKAIYHCMRNLSHVLCDTYVDDMGREVHGYVAYVSDGKVKTKNLDGR